MRYSTPNERPEAETLEERRRAKKMSRFANKYSWLNLINRETSACGLRRIGANTTDSQTGALQVQELDQRHKKPKVMYGNHRFLAVFLKVKQAK